MQNDRGSVRDLITSEALALVRSVASQGSMAGAARELGLVPSAVTYRIRQIEEGLDVLLFDRSAKNARITVAGEALLSEGERVLRELDSVARRVKRVATGWEPQLTIAVDSLISKSTLFELTEQFLRCGPGGSAPPTRLHLQDETLSGTLQALLDGRAELCIGSPVESISEVGIQAKVMGESPFVFAVAPHHPLAKAPEPLTDISIQEHRIVAVADSTRRPSAITVGILPGQDVLTVSTMGDKVEAQVRGLGCGFLPLSHAQMHLNTGRLVAKTTERLPRVPQVSYAWRKPARGDMGKALAWWVKQLGNVTVRQALLAGR